MKLIVSVLGSAANSAIRPGVLLNQQTTPSSSSSSSSNTENNKNNHGNPNFLMDSLSEELGTTAENSQLAVRQNSELDAMLLGIDYDNHFDAAKQSFEDGFTDFMDRLNVKTNSNDKRLLISYKASFSPLSLSIGSLFKGDSIVASKGGSSISKLWCLGRWEAHSLQG